DARGGSTSTFPPATACRARADRRACLQHRPVPDADSLPARHTAGERRFLATGAQVPPRTSEPELPRRGRADSESLGVVLAAARGRRAGPRLVPAARYCRQPCSLQETPQRCGVPELASADGGPIRPLAEDDARPCRRCGGMAGGAVAEQRLAPRLRRRSLADLPACESDPVAHRTSGRTGAPTRS